jgi:hypothetical protein
MPQPSLLCSHDCSAATARGSTARLGRARRRASSGAACFLAAPATAWGICPRCSFAPRANPGGLPPPPPPARQPPSKGLPPGAGAAHAPGPISTHSVRRQAAAERAALKGGPPAAGGGAVEQAACGPLFPPISLSICPGTMGPTAAPCGPDLGQPSIVFVTRPRPQARRAPRAIGSGRASPPAGAPHGLPAPRAVAGAPLPSPLPRHPNLAFAAHGLTRGHLARIEHVQGPLPPPTSLAPCRRTANASRPGTLPPLPGLLRPAARAPHPCGPRQQPTSSFQASPNTPAAAP